MADEAVVRIVLDESGAQQAPAAPVASAPPTSLSSKTTPPPAPAVVPTPGAATPEEIRREADERAKRLAVRRAEIERAEFIGPPAPPVSPSAPTGATPEEIEQERQERAERIAARRAEIEARDSIGPPAPAVVPTTSTQPPAPSTTTQAAQPSIQPVIGATSGPSPEDVQAALQRQIEIYEAMMPQPGSPAAIKLEKLKAQLARGGVQEDATTGFDPVALAKKRVEAEQKRALVELEYQKLRPITAQAKSGLDALLDSVESMRGTIFAMGGSLGRTVSTILLITSRIRAIRAEAAARAEAAPSAIPTLEAEPPEVIPAAIPVEHPVPDAPVAQHAPEAAAAPGPGPTPVPAATVPTGAATGAGTAAAGGAAAGGMAGGIAAAAPYAAIALVVVGAIKGLVDTLDRTAQKYAEYSPMIAQAQAQAEIKAIMNDMRRAQESGPELAKLVKAQSEMQQHWEDIKIKVLMELTPIVTKILQAVNILARIASTREVEFDRVKDPTEIILDPERVRKVREGATSPLTPEFDIIR